MERYSEYKDSGIQWIGEIPSHWKVVPIKRIAYLQSGDGIKPDDFTDEGYPVFGGNGFRGYTSKYTNEGDYALIGRQGALCGNINYASGKFFATEHAIVVYPLHNEPTRWLGEVLRTANLNRLSMTAAQPGLAVSVIKKEFIPVPPLSEQKAIVDFLDTQTSRIDSFIANVEREIELLGEAKQRIIADAVTKGLKKDVEMKDSGISWCKKIPTHWEQKRIASIFSSKPENNSDFKFKHAYKFNYGTIVPKNEIGNPDEYREIYEKYSVVKKDDIMINGLNLNYDFISQRVAIVPDDGIITSAYLVMRPKNTIIPMYYCYLFKAMDSMKMFHGMGTGIRLTLSFQEIKKYLVPIPPIEEQQAIVDFISQKTSQIDALISSLSQQITSLKEYKQRLISDVVTGQIKVC